jgi:hypothetical protein
MLYTQQDISISLLLDFENIFCFLPKEKPISWRKEDKVEVQIRTFKNITILKQHLSDLGAIENPLISEKYGIPTYQWNEKYILVFKHYNASRAVICPSYSEFLIYRFRLSPYFKQNMVTQEYNFLETQEILEKYEGKITNYVNKDIAVYALSNGQFLLIDLILFEKQIDFPGVSYSYPLWEVLYLDKLAHLGIAA